jgi:hypothetical protein
MLRLGKDPIATDLESTGRDQGDLAGSPARSESRTSVNASAPNLTPNVHHTMENTMDGIGNEVEETISLP